MTAITPHNKFLLITFITAGLVLTSTLFAREMFFNVSAQDLQTSKSLYGVKYQDQKDYFEVIPSKVKKPNTAVIFYPGALVDSKAYAPKLASVASTVGVKVFILKPSLRLADLDIKSANQIIKYNRDITNWYVGGHSMGGGAACNFANHNQDLINGLILFAAYCSDNDKKYAGSTLLFYGSDDPLEPLHKLRTKNPQIYNNSRDTGSKPC